MPGEKYKSSIYHYIVVVIVHSLSHVQLFATPQIIKCQASLSSIISWSMRKSGAIELVMLSNNFILFCLLLCLPSVFPSIRVISNESTHSSKWPEYWSFSFSIIIGLISFRIDSLISLQSKGLSSLLQHHNSKASVLRCSAYFMVQISHLYLTSGKTITFHIRSFVSLRKNKYFSWYIKNVSFVFMNNLNTDSSVQEQSRFYFNIFPWDSARR